MTKYYKDTNGKPFQDATDAVIEKCKLVEIDKSSFDAIVTELNTPTDAEVLAQEVAKKEAYLVSTDWIVIKINEVAITGGDTSDLLEKYSDELSARVEAREFINANEV